MPPGLFPQQQPYEIGWTEGERLAEDASEPGSPQPQFDMLSLTISLH